MKTILRNLQARLDRQALAQLREAAARQAEEIERLQAELEKSERRAEWFSEAADMWQEAVMELEQKLPAGQHLALHQDGSLSLAQGGAA